MSQPATEVLVASRLSDLCRQACAYAGLPARGTLPAGSHFVIRSGQEPAELLAKLLEEALPEDAPEMTPVAEGADPREVPAGQVVVRGGFDAPCPIGRDLEEVLRPGRPLSFAVERHDPAGRLLSRTWVVLSEELPLPEVPLTAAVARETFGDDSSCNPLPEAAGTDVGAPPRPLPLRTVTDVRAATARAAASRPVVRTRGVDGALPRGTLDPGSCRERPRLTPGG